MIGRLPPATIVAIWLVRLGLFVVASLASLVTVAQAWAVEPAYVERGRQTEAQQRAFHARLDSIHETLADRLRDGAPDLLARLDPPKRLAPGYQVLPRVVPDTPAPALASRPKVNRFSWPWSEVLIARAIDRIAEMESELARLPSPPQARAAYKALADDYRQAQAQRRRIDSNIGHTGFWQRAIAADRARFDRENAALEAALARQAIEEALETGDESALRSAARGQQLDDTSAAAALREMLHARALTLEDQVREYTGGASAQNFVSVAEAGPSEWEVSVLMYTDVTDTAFAEAFKAAVEDAWQVRDGGREYRLRLRMESIPPERLYCSRGDVDSNRQGECTPPVAGASIDVRAHVGLFPLDGGILTTGATSLHVTAGRALVLGPHDVAPRTLAHELGHILGFKDGYLRGHRDLGDDGIEVLELTPDSVDIMAATKTGVVTAHHFEQLIRSNAATREPGAHRMATEGR